MIEEQNNNSVQNQNGNKSKPMLANRFNIDFFEFSFLVEACIPPRPIARAMFWDDVINKHYHALTENERKKLFDWVNRCYGMEHGLENRNEDCLLFNARFDKENQYKVRCQFQGEEKTVDCFKWNDRYHISKTQSLLEEYIIEATRVSETVC
jgi:hypothetical protein